MCFRNLKFLHYDDYDYIYRWKSKHPKYALMEILSPYRWSTKVTFPSTLCRVMNSELELHSERSLQLGILVTWSRPIATRQQWAFDWISSWSTRSTVLPAHKTNVSIQVNQATVTLQTSFVSLLLKGNLKPSTCHNKMQRKQSKSRSCWLSKAGIW